MSQAEIETVKGIIKGKKSGKKRKKTRDARKNERRGVDGFGIAWLRSHESQQGNSR